MTRRPWMLVALLSATATASYLCRVNISVTGALLMNEFSLSQIQMGRIFSAFLLGYALMQIPGGVLADRWGAPRVLAGSALWWVVGTVLLSAAGWGPFRGSAAGVLTALLVLRFVIGVGEAPTFPAAALGVSRWIPTENQGRANGIVIAAIGLGSALAPPVLTAIMVRWGWRLALLVSALPAMVVAVAWRRLRNSELPNLPLSLHKSTDQPLASLRSASFILLTLSYTLQGYVGYIFVFWFYLYLVQVRHFDLLRSAALSSLPWILSILSIPIGGMISDRLVAGPLGLRWGRRAIPLFGLTFAGVFLTLGARTGNPYLAAVSLAFATALVLSVEGPFWATMMEIAGRRSGAAGGVMNMGSNIGGLISPALTPILANRMGWENALYVAAALSVVGALLWFGISPTAARVVRSKVLPLSTVPGGRP
ncbi:MAG: MFS transporter [Acidobacteriia bacterium]|nr:MFS transporter [Terriglobia bacterium]